MQFGQNTKKNWTLRFMIYPSRGRRGWYTAVCLDLALIREGQDFFKLRKQITLLALKYARSVTKHNLNDALLNQKLPPSYVQKFRTAGRDERLRRKWQEVFDAIIWEQSQGRDTTISTIRR